MSPAPHTGRGRRSVCGTDLARIRPPRLLVDADSIGVLLAVQQRLDALLSADGPQKVNSCGQLVPVAQYFIDLRVVATLVLASWPEASGFARHPPWLRQLGEKQTSDCATADVAHQAHRKDRTGSTRCSRLWNPP